MAEIKGNTKPDSVLGEAIFLSYDGLRAEGNGKLGFLTFDQSAVEMRSVELLSALPAQASGLACIFVQKFALDQEDFWLIGVVKKIKDYNKRAGILGSCVCIRFSDPKLDGVGGYLLDVLQSEIDDTFEEIWNGKPLPRHLNVLDNVPTKESDANYSSNSGFELVYRTDEVDLDDAVSHIMTRIYHAKRIGQVFLFPHETVGARPIDKKFVDAIATMLQRVAEKEKHKAEQEKQESIRQAKIAHARRTTISRDAESMKRKVQTLENQFIQSGIEQHFEIDDADRDGDSVAVLTDDEISRHLANLNKRIARLEASLSRRKNKTISNRLPIDQAMALKIGPTTNLKTDQIVLLAGISVAAIFILSVAFFFLWKLAPENKLEALEKPSGGVILLDDAVTLPNARDCGSVSRGLMPEGAGSYAKV